MKLHKHRNLVRTTHGFCGNNNSAMGSGVLSPSGNVKSTPAIAKSAAELEPILDWMVHEDWALLQAIQVYQGLPLNLMILSPGHTPNWDLVADIVNNISRIYRSPKQCRSRYEAVIVPREEGKILCETTPKKQKKQKSIYKLSQPGDVCIPNYY